MTDRRLLILAIGMFALGTSYVVAGILPEISRAFDVSVGAVGIELVGALFKFFITGDEA